MRFDKWILGLSSVVIISTACNERPRYSEAPPPVTNTAEPARPMETAKPAERLNNERTATAHFKAKTGGSLTGDVEIREIENATGKLTIKLSSAKPGTYAVYAFDTTDCAAIPMMNTASNSTSQSDKTNAETAKKLLDLGQITVSADGKGRIEVATGMYDPNNNLDRLDKKAIGIYERHEGKPLTGTSTSKTAEACGIVTVEKASEITG